MSANSLPAEGIDAMQLFNGPQFINWNYTYVCNLKCLHCYSRATRYPRELSTSRYLEIAADIVASGVFTVAFGGGEPLYRKDIYDVANVLKDGGVALYLTTNGWYLDAQRAADLKRAGFRRVLLSIDSVSERVNDDVRGLGSFETALRGLSLCREAGINSVGISCVISKENIDGIEKMVELGARHSVHEIEFKKFRPSGLGLKNRLRFELEPSAEFDVARLEARGEELGVKISVLGFSRFDEIKQCPCGWRSMCIRPNGDLTHCSYTDTICGSLASSTLEEVWRTSPVLNAIRRSGSCEAVQGAAFPSNPALSEASEKEPVAAGR